MQRVGGFCFGGCFGHVHPCGSLFVHQSLCRLDRLWRMLPYLDLVLIEYGF